MSIIYTDRVRTEKTERHSISVVSLYDHQEAVRKAESHTKETSKLVTELSKELAIVREMLREFSDGAAGNTHMMLSKALGCIEKLRAEKK